MYNWCEANRQKLVATKKGVENSHSDPPRGSTHVHRRFRVSGPKVCNGRHILDIREDVVGALEQGSRRSMTRSWLSQGTIRNAVGAHHEDGVAQNTRRVNKTPPHISIFLLQT